jgi:tRNA threonylcarbamoyladenosine biosynthesis protein TsaB
LPAPDPSCCLAIEASTERVGLAVSHRGQSWACEAVGVPSPSRHVYEWLAAVLGAARLTPADITRVAFGSGPGSFTGVRVAAAVAQAIAYGRGVPVWRLSSLAALAAAALRATGATRVVVALDARMAGAYVGEYALGPAGVLVALQPDRLVPADAPLAVGGTPFVAAGPGFAACPALLSGAVPGPGAILSGLLPSVHDVLQLALAESALGQTVAVKDALPNYLRDRVTR